MYIFELVQFLVNCFNTNLNYKSFLSNDLINLINEYYLKNDKKIYQFDNSKFNSKPIYNEFLIKGLPFVDNFIPKDNYKKFNKDKPFDKPIYHKKHYQIGFNSFLSFIKPFINDKNIVNYYNQKINLFNDLNTTFEYKQVFKINLNSIDIEKLNKKHLLFKNDLNLLNLRIKVNFYRYDEFISNVFLKSNFKIHNDIKYNLGTNRDYKKGNEFLKHIIIVVEVLNHDEKYNYILCNRKCYADILNLLSINTIQWYDKKNDKLYRAIKSKQYTYIDINDRHDELLKQLKQLKRQYKKLDKKASFYRKELKLLINSNKTNSARFDKLNNKFDSLVNQLNDIDNDLTDINDELILLDKKNDEFLNNIVDEKINYSLKLKSYLD